MDLLLHPSELEGNVRAIASKSVAHRLVILAALSDATTDIDCPSSSADIEATVSCMQALGARISRTRLGFRIVGRPRVLRRQLPFRQEVLDCGESGSTLRFLLPIVAALGCGGSFVGKGRLAERPLSPLYEELEAHGVTLSAQGSFPLDVSGRLEGGTFRLPGNVSSQFVSGLLLAAPLVEGPVRIVVSDPVESEPYIKLTMRALAAFGVDVAQSSLELEGRKHTVFEVGDATLSSPGSLPVEGDWSNAAFWLAAGASSPYGIEVSGLDASSAQGDRAILAALALAGARVGRTRASAAVRHESLRPFEVDVSSIPDLVPPLAAVASRTLGTSRLTHAGRLRLKESDRLATVSAAINGCGGHATVEGDDLVITGGTLTGGTLTGGEVDAANDHRIAMLVAILAAGCTGPVTLRDAGCVAKSYPSFWEDYVSLGGRIEEL